MTTVRWALLGLCSGCLSLGDLLPDIESPEDGEFGFVVVDGERFPIDDVDRADVTEVTGVSLLEVSARGNRAVDAISFTLSVVDAEGSIASGQSYDALEEGTTGAVLAIAFADALQQAGVLYCAGGGEDDDCPVDGDPGSVTIEAIDEGEVRLTWDVRMASFDEESDAELGDVTSTAQLTIPLTP